MKIVATSLLVICLVALGLWFSFKENRPDAPDPILSEETGAEEGEIALPKLSEYPVVEKYAGKPAEPNFTTRPKAKMFETKIKEGAAQGPNFAGKYTVVTWGCGTSCQSSAVLDAQTGAIISYGILSARDLLYSLDSTLLVVNPRENLHPEELSRIKDNPDEAYPDGSTPAFADYYEMKDGALTFASRRHVVTGESPFCIQVVVEAINPITQEKEMFGSPCTVPYGFQVVEPEIIEG